MPVCVSLFHSLECFVAVLPHERSSWQKSGVVCDMCCVSSTPSSAERHFIYNISVLFPNNFYGFWCI